MGKVRGLSLACPGSLTKRGLSLACPSPLVDRGLSLACPSLESREAPKERSGMATIAGLGALLRSRAVAKVATRLSSRRRSSRLTSEPRRRTNGRRLLKARPSAPGELRLLRRPRNGRRRRHHPWRARRLASDLERMELLTRHWRGRLRRPPSLISCGGLPFMGGRRTGMVSEPAYDGARAT